MPKSNWDPPEKNLDPLLLTCINNFTQEIENLNVISEKRNLPKPEFNMLKQLSENSNLVIKKSDKGSSTVVMDKKHYLTEGYRQLNNSLHYERIPQPLYPQIAPKMAIILKKMKDENHITEKEFKFLLPPSEPRARRFYMLPKIHKPLECWTIPHKMPPGRHIVSDCNSISKNIAGLIDYHLKRYAIQHPSYIKNTYDFVDKIRNLSIPPNSLLITLDVESMYTNISHEKGILAVKEAFNDLYFSDAILELLELSLKNNDFVFNNEWFVQTSGTAMGVDYAPHYADIYMAKFEKEALQKCPLKPHTYLRFLDDVFIIWPHSIESFHTFLDILNNHEPPIKFKSTVNENSVDYLDTTIFKNQCNTSQLLTKVYFKPTDNHLLLHKQSFHPKHTFKGILKSQIIRFHRICSRQHDFIQSCSILFNSLRARNYSKRWLRDIKAETIRELQIKSRRSNYCNPTSSKCGANPCMINRCKSCIILEECHNITSRVTQKTYGVTGQLNCSSSNVVYALQCIICYKQYIGETSAPLRERINHHRSAIKNNHPDSALNAHLNMHIEKSEIKYDEYNIESFDLTPIEIVPKADTAIESKKLRLERETFWIDTLDTMEPQGLNKKRSDDIVKNSQNGEIVAFVVPFSKTANIASRIIKKHFKLLKDQHNYDDFEYNIISAYSKHKNVSDKLVSSKT